MLQVETQAPTSLHYSTSRNIYPELIHYAAYTRRQALWPPELRRRRPPCVSKWVESWTSGSRSTRSSHTHQVVRLESAKRGESWRWWAAKAKKSWRRRHISRHLIGTNRAWRRKA